MALSEGSDAMKRRLCHSEGRAIKERQVRGTVIVELSII